MELQTAYQRRGTQAHSVPEYLERGRYGEDTQLSNLSLLTTKTGSKTNLAPFSYFQLIGHDPPLFSISFSGSGGVGKDSLANVKKTGECLYH